MKKKSRTKKTRHVKNGWDPSKVRVRRPVGNCGTVALNKEEPTLVCAVISQEDIEEMEDRLALLHHAYFQREKITRILLHDLGIDSIEELKKTFLQYDIDRGKKGWSKRALAVLLGAKTAKPEARL